jgi:hypothetical protein
MTLRSRAGVITRPAKERSVSDYPALLEKLGTDGLAELRRLIAEQLARRPTRDLPPSRPGGPDLPGVPGMPGPDEDLRPRS